MRSPTHWPVSINTSEQFENNLIKYNLCYNKASANVRRRSINENEWMKIMKAVASDVAFLNEIAALAVHKLSSNNRSSCQ